MKITISTMVACLAMAVTANSALAAKERTGAQVVRTVCAKCHAAGEKGAPKVGDIMDWGARMSGGMSSLTEHAVRGYREMPAHGGESAVTDLELTRAIVYMIVPQSSAHADLKKSMVTAKISGKELYNRRCHDCHENGMNGAPRVDDSKEWGKRMSKGINGLVLSAVKGHKSMPSRGGLATISDAEIRLAIIYMIGTASTEFAKQQAATGR